MRFQKGDAAGARADCEEALRRAPASHRAHLARARLLREDARSQREALAVVDRALALRPKSARLYAERAYTRLLQSWSVETALVQEDAAQALQLDPNCALAHAVRAWLLAFFRAGWEAGKNAALLALKHDPNCVPALVALGFSLVNRDKTAAISFSQRALRMEPRNADAHYVLAMCLGATPRAKQHLNRAIALRETHMFARLARAKLRWVSGDHAAALPDLEMVLRLRPRILQVRINLASCLLGAGRADEAYRQVQDVLRRDPQSLPALALRARIKVRLGKRSEAITDYLTFLRQEKLAAKRIGPARQLLELQLERWPGESEQTHVTRLIGDAKRHNNPAGRAIGLELVARAISLRPKSVQAWRARASLHLGAASWPDVETATTRVLALDPNDARSWTVRATVRLRLKKTALALADAERALALDPKRSEAHATRGVALSRLGRHPEAVAALTRAVELDGARRPRLLVERAAARLGAGDEPGARADLQAFLKLVPKGRAADQVRAKLRELSN